MSSIYVNISIIFKNISFWGHLFPNIFKNISFQFINERKNVANISFIYINILLIEDNISFRDVWKQIWESPKSFI